MSRELPRLYTEQEISEKTGIPVGTLQAWRRDKMGPSYVKIGRAVRYEHETVLKFIESHRVSVDVQISEELEGELAS